MHYRLYDELIKKGLMVDVQDEQGKTALMMAAANGHEEIVEVLLTKKPNLLLQNKSGNTALHWAAYMGRKKITQILLTHEHSKLQAKEAANIFNVMALINSYLRAYFYLCYHFCDLLIAR